MNPRIVLSFALCLSLASCGIFKDKPQSGSSSGPQFEHEVFGDQPGNPAARSEQNSPLSLQSNGELEAFIQDWYGTPHRMGGMTKNGVDCSGFVIIAYREVFGRSFKGRRAEDLFSEMEVIDQDELSYGDLVFFKVRGRRIDHVGIYLQNGAFAHTSSSKGVMISKLSNTYWSKRYFKAAAYKD